MIHRPFWKHFETATLLISVDKSSVICRETEVFLIWYGNSLLVCLKKKNPYQFLNIPS